jgi:isopentenyl-diphosphate Delta-isomerase
MTIQKRKKDHVDLTVQKDVFYQKSAGFNRFDFNHNALPEISIEEVNPGKSLLGRTFSFPLFISSMTGGYSDAGPVNAQLAAFCEKQNLPLGVGSQRAMLEDPHQTKSFSVVRKHAPNAFIAANIGGAQLIGGLTQDKIRALIDSIRADAVIVHLNPLQELMQPEGDTNFKGILDGIDGLVQHADVPVIAKETGAGISKQVAEKLLQTGVSVIDVSGAGGTSWAKVENLRERVDEPLNIFNDWGLPTADCIIEINELRKNYEFEIIGSGGIRTSFDIAKAIALGADFTAVAQPIIKALFNGGLKELEQLLEHWIKETRIILTLLGCRSFTELNQTHLRKIQ